jgi:hypothetical protein
VDEVAQNNIAFVLLVVCYLPQLAPQILSFVTK